MTPTAMDDGITTTSVEALTNALERGKLTRMDYRPAGVKEQRLGSLEPGRRFEMWVRGNKTPITGTLVAHSKDGTTCAVVCHESGPHLGQIFYWDAGAAVVRLNQVRKLHGQFDFKSGTGVGFDMHHPANFYRGKQDAAETDDDTMAQTATRERVAGLPIGGAAKGKTLPTKKGPKLVKEAKAARTPKPLNDCLDGCGEKVAGRFRQGHDARYYSLLKQVDRGDLAFNKLPALMQKNLGSAGAVKKELAKHGKH